MTKSPREVSGVGATPPGRTTLCRWCQRLLDQPTGAGRPRQYCRASCRQQAFMARKLAAGHGLGDDEVIVRRADLEAVQDRVALLRQAIGDLERDERGGALDAEQAFPWLLGHATEVAALRIEPVWSERAPLT